MAPDRTETGAPPLELAELRCWLVWKLIHKADKKKPLKVPFYVSGNPRGQQNTDEDRAQLVTYREALAALQSGAYDGVGFAVLQGAGIVVLDFDDCVTHGVIAPHVERLCDGTYTEFSPSGNGAHAVFIGSLTSRKDVDCKRGAFPIEVFGHNGFVTFTGRATETCTLFGYDDQLAPLSQVVLDEYVARGWSLDQVEAAGPSGDALMLLQPTLDISLGEVADILQRVSPDIGYEDWVQAGMALHQQTNASEEGFQIWNRWSAQSPKYVGERDLRSHWASFGRNASVRQLTFNFVQRLAREAETDKKYDATEELKKKISECSDMRTLRERVCPYVARDSRIGDVEREELAHALRQRATSLGGVLSMKMCRDLVGATKARDLDNVDGEAADVLNARILADMMADDFVYEHNGAGWRRWADGAWRKCGLGEEVERAKDLSAHIIATRGTNVGARNVEEVLQQADRANMLAGVKAALELARSDARIAVAPEQFDDDPKFLNTRNGLLDLETGVLHEHHPSQRVARQCGAIYDPNAKCPRWERFMLEISVNDPEWVDFVQRACGYTLTGRVGEEVMFFMLGGGANGKSVMADVMTPLFGTYATAVPAKFLARSDRDGEAATPSLASLPGARLALANEVEAGSRLSAQTVKIACSTERIVARHNYAKAPFTFQPTHKLWVRGNHRPIITDNDEGIWRRIILIPFEHSVPAAERDLGLARRLLAEESAGILAWMVRGYSEYRRRGLQPTGRIAAASRKYRKDSDLFGQWLDERGEIGQRLEAAEPDAYRDYRWWCEQQGLKALPKATLTRALGERGIEQAGQRKLPSGDRVRFYRGFRLLNTYFPERDVSASEINELF